MLALNFQSELHEKLLIEHKKNYTIRPATSAASTWRTPSSG